MRPTVPFPFNQGALIGAASPSLLFSLPTPAVRAQLPVPNFSASPVTGCAPLLVNFTDLSTGATSWEWNLGNGVTSNQRNPSTVYFNPGTYTVTLTVTNAGGTQTLTRTNYITVGTLPTVDFSASARSGCAPLQVQFSDLSQPGFGSIVSWNWSFGNGDGSTQQNPQYTYTQPGTYFVSLTVTNNAGCSRTLSRPAYITVNPPLTPDFSFSAPQRCTPPETISFTNLSTGPGTLSYQWNFGDGNTSTATNPAHNYTTAGPFSVQLTVTSSVGCTATITRPNAIQLNSFQPVIGIPDSACVRTNIAFQNLSTPLPASSSWSFGDGTFSTQTNPVKSYLNPGTYTVKLVNQYASCRDSVTRVLVVKPRPVSVITSPDRIGCAPPHTVRFTDSSINAVSWFWNFGDGTTSTQQNPTHTYNSYGFFTVQLITTNAIGCSDTSTRVNFIRIERPVFNPQISPSEGCRLLTSQFLANTTAVDSIVSWFWDFGDGTTSTLRNPVHTFDSGTYTIKLRVQTGLGCFDSIVLPNRIRVGTKPTAAFTANPLNVCAFSTVSFTDASSGNPNQWNWNFGNGIASTLQNPTTIYQDTGLFTVRLTVFNNRCPDTSTVTGLIRVLPPIARFTSAVICSSSKRDVQFTDQSVVATGWSWDFGDGNTSTLQNPVHTYAALGTYTVTLTTTNGSCTHSTTRTVRLVDEVPTFTANRQTLCRNESVQFTASVPNPANVVAYNWDFGDGKTGTGSTVTNTYTIAGNFSVRLITTDINGCRDTIIQTDFIRVNGATANFTNPAPLVCIGSPVAMTNTTATDGINNLTQVTWSMGNGVRITSTDNPFSYTYPVAGTYTIRLIVRDAAGCADSIQRTNIVRVLDPKARFRVIDTPSCPGAVLTFQNQSTGTATPSYVWDFGDGATSTATSPTHSYADTGRFAVKLLLTEAIGCRDSLTYNVRISRPFAAFTLNDSISICEIFEARFTNTSTFGQTYFWDFGDGTTSTLTNPVHYYAGPGTFQVKLVTTSPGGCTDSSFARIRLGTGTGTLTYSPLSGCAPLTVALQTSTDVPLTYTWDLGDGNLLTGTDSNLTHTYEAGFYFPNLLVNDRIGCFGVIAGADTIKAFGSRPNFGADKWVLCDSGTVQFTDSTFTPDVITGYFWDFGDGGTSTLANPRHLYTAPGLYTVTLTTNTQTGCTNSRTKPAFIKVVPSPQIRISGDTSFCMPASFRLDGQWLNPDTSSLQWTWDVNGQSFTGPSTPQLVRPTSDSIRTRLIAVNGNGCTDTAYQLVVVHPLPTVSAGNDTTICLGTAAVLQPAGAQTYTWSPATYLSCTNCPNPQAFVTDPIQYTVTGTSAFGCRSTDSVIVRVKKPFRITATGSDTLCAGEQAPLRATGAENYLWVPSAGLSANNIPNPVATPSVTTRYTVIGFDSLNCFRDSAVVTVSFYRYPIIAMPRDTIIRSGTGIQLLPQISADGTTFLWTPPNGLSCTSCPNPVASPLVTTRYRITASNPGGCASFADVVVQGRCGKEDIFIPNAFTPNGDNRNDYFYIIGNGLQSVKSLRIFNRWGNKVFERTFFNANTPNLGWDGTLRGQPQPPGTYTYVAEALCGDGSIIPLTGTVTLIR